MNTELRRSKRYNDFLAVSVLARNGENGNNEVGPFAGRIVNISRHGACLLMSLGMLDAYNVYSSTYKNASLHLEIKGNIPDDIDNFTLSGRPVWMDPVVIDDIRAFKMGVNFMSGVDSEQSDDIIDNITAEPIDDILEPPGP
jgi:Tfp pilus assembly protein PilZ